MANGNGSATRQRCHVVLVPGFGGFDALGQVEYYAGVTSLFQSWNRRQAQRPVVLHYFDNLPTAAVSTRATRLRRYLAKRMARGEILATDDIVLVGHSTGGLDIRQLIWDLHDLGDSPITVDGGWPVIAQHLLKRIHGVVFLSVPHWGTNIAEWVYSHPVLRTSVITDLQAAFAGSQAYLVDQVEAGLAHGVAHFANADVMLALSDALTEGSTHGKLSSPTRLADAQEAASDLELYFRQMATDFHVINDLTPQAHEGEASPAQFDQPKRREEITLWSDLKIRTLSYATVGGRACNFATGAPAPVFSLANLFDDACILAGARDNATNDLSYRLCYRACAGGPLEVPRQRGRISRVLGPRPPEQLELWDNDGIVNTISMLWPVGEIVLVQADHLDIVGHYVLEPPEGGHCFADTATRAHTSYDILKSSPKFEKAIFHEIWKEIFLFAAIPDSYARTRKGPLSSSAIPVAAVSTS